jgi:hypothetical protein
MANAATILELVRDACLHAEAGEMQDVIWLLEVIEDDLVEIAGAGGGGDEGPAAH